ncbi:MAG: threonine--tRNA ligase [Candidatus Woesearchaeota archaeon]
MVVVNMGNSKHVFKSGITCSEIAGSLNIKDAVAAKVDGEQVDLSYRVDKDCTLEFIKLSSSDGLTILRHTAAHILAQAVLRLFPKALLTIGPAVEDGFYYDIDHEPFTPEDIKRIEEEMHRIVKENLPIIREEISKEEALKLFSKNPYKIEMINELPGGIVSIYRQGEFFDLCRGPHLPYTSLVKAFKLTKIAGAYWRADAKNKQLQRIYGIAFPEEKQLKYYITMMEEAEQRDHRKIGREMDLFSFHEEGPGFPFFHPKGVIILNELVQFWREEHSKAGYQEIKTPIILSKTLWERSGHWEHYRNNMYFTKIDEKDFAVKPMNCPGGILVYKSSPKSYRDLPLKLSELGLVHRHELSGVLSGLFRVRCFTQDDAHIYVTEDQIEEEVVNVVRLVDKFYKKFGFEYHVELSTRPEDYMGELELWNRAESSLKHALESLGMKYKINEGDGAFYGPKIDFHIKDCIGRTWQCGTVQLDFQMPIKFDLEYDGQDGKKHRPVMIHRVVYGSLERFLGILIEHYAGRFPLWLAPVQVRILTVADRHNEYASQIENMLSSKKLRVELDSKAQTIAYKVRDAQLQRIPVILTVGDKEVSSRTVALRTLDGRVKFNVDPAKLTEILIRNVEERSNSLELDGI